MKFIRLGDWDEEERRRCLENSRISISYGGRSLLIQWQRKTELGRACLRVEWAVNLIYKSSKTWRDEETRPSGQKLESREGKNQIPKG